MVDEICNIRIWCQTSKQWFQRLELWSLQEPAFEVFVAILQMFLLLFCKCFCCALQDSWWWVKIVHDYLSFWDFSVKPAVELHHAMCFFSTWHSKHCLYTMLVELCFPGFLKLCLQISISIPWKTPEFNKCIEWWWVNFVHRCFWFWNFAGGRCALTPALHWYHLFFKPLGYL